MPLIIRGPTPGKEDNTNKSAHIAPTLIYLKKCLIPFKLQSNGLDRRALISKTKGFLN